MRFLLIISLILLLPLNLLHAQSWSEPVAVTSGPGDDRNVTGYQEWDDPLRLAWDRTENNQTDVYTLEMDWLTGQCSDEMRITERPAIDEKPSIVYGLYPNGIIFQSKLSERSSIHFAAQTETGYLEPNALLYSDIDLYDPLYAPIISDIIQPCIFFRSDSCVNWYENFDPWTIPPGSTYYCPTWSFGYPVYSYDAYWEGGGIIPFHDMRLVWEYEVNDRTRIGYEFEIEYSGTFSGTLSSSSHSYHKPVLREFDLYMERESDTDFDIVSSYMSTTIGGFSQPQPIFESTGNEMNPSAWDGHVVFEADWSGNWDIAFWHYSLGGVEIVDDHPAQDRNPFVICINNVCWVFWESDRDGSWKIYSSHRAALDVQEDADHQVPRDFSLSAYPNPFNATTVVSFNLPVAGEVAVGVYDVFGRDVGAGLKPAPTQGSLYPPGRHEVRFDAGDLPSGVYIVRLEAGEFRAIKKVVLLK
jgi:hypothetical protein